METKLNIAKILKGKPINTKLYDLVRDINVYLTNNPDSCNGVYCTFIKNGIQKLGYSSKGTLVGFENGMIVLAPSKSMQDWSKFAWKKGDLLVNSCGFQCIFKEWASDDYTKFNGCYSNSRDGYEDISNARTDKFDKLDNNVAYSYIREIERKLGGKLNLTTLKIEKAQPEFKDGDIVFVRCKRYCFIEIFNYFKNDILNDYASINTTLQMVDIGGEYPIFKDEIVEIHLATDSEKKQLFDALAKKNKAWDAEKKQIVNLKPKWTPKTFDRVITRDFDDGVWSANIFSHINSQGEYVSIGCVEGYAYCLPYNEETAKLIGTTNNAK